MPTSTLRSADGSTITVEHEAGATPDAIKALARTKMRGGSEAPRPAAKPAAPPDMIGRAKGALTKEPPAGDRTGVSRAILGDTIGGWDTPGRVVRAAGDLMLPGTWGEAARQVATLPIPGSWATAPLGRIAAGATAGATADSISQGSTGVMDFASKMAKHGGAQAVGEVLPGALNFGLTQRAGRPLVAAQAQTKAARDAAEATRQSNARPEHSANAQRIRQEHARIEDARATKFKEAETARKREHAEKVAAAEKEHATQVRAYEQDGARSIADAFKSKVSAFRSFGSDERGLLGMVFGQGPAKLSAEYDKVMKDIARLGRGQDVVIPGNDAAAFGLKPTGIVQSVDPRLPNMARVDAAALAEAATGAWKKNPGAYRRAAHALDELGIGNPEARAEYKSGMALIDFASKSNMLKGETFNPEAARAAFTNVKVLDQLRKRGEGDIFTGPIADAVRRPRPELRLPAEPPPIAAPRALAKPLVPPFRKPPSLAEVSDVPEGVRAKKLPNMGFVEGAVIAEIPFLISSLLTGHAHHGYGLPGVAGGLGARALSGRQFIMEAPQSAASKFATSVTPAILSQEAAGATR